MKKGFIGLVFLLVTQICCAQFSLRSDQPIKLACDNVEEKVVQTALKLFIRDYQSVFSASAAVDARQGNIIVATVGKKPVAESCECGRECFGRQETGFSFAGSAGW